MEAQSIIINLAKRYAVAFGVQAGGAVIDRVFVDKKDDGKDYKFEIYTPNNIDFEEVTFEFEDKELYFGKMLLEEGKFFAPPLIFNFSRQKQLIETTVSGSDNVIVERWGTMPWAIEAKGLLIDVSNRQYPSEKIKGFVQLFEHNNIIKVYGSQFEDKGIDSIYIKDISINPVEGFADTVRVDFSAISIKELSYNLVE